MAWSEDLDPSTEAYAIAASSSGRLRVLAGPGTGKSFAMKRRVARILESGVSPRTILPVTFTRVAAEDLHRELVQLNVPGCTDLNGRTLHSFGLRVLMRHHALTATGRIARPLNRFELEALLNDLKSEFGGKRKTKRLHDQYLAAWAKTQGAAPGFNPGSEEERFSNEILDWLLFHEGMLIGEIVPYLLNYLFQNPAAPERSEFSHILVDEFQDLNQAEQLIVSLLGQTAEITIVGDEDQSIYSFKFAHPEGIRDWHLDNPGCADHVLSDCYRCPTQVVEIANALISRNSIRSLTSLDAVPANGTGAIRQIQFSSFEEESSWIANEILSLTTTYNTHPGDVIVLVQRKALGTEIVKKLRALGVPTKSYYEETQLDSDESQLRFAALKLLVDREDRVALRYLLGLGSNDMRAKSYKRLRDHCELMGQSPWQALMSLQAGLIKIPHTKSLVDQFANIQSTLDSLDTHQNSLTDLVDTIFPSSMPELSELRGLALAALDEVETIPDLLSFMMEEITQPEIPLEIGDVRVMSLHKSKGLSSPVVFIGGCVEGVIPKQPDSSTPLVAQKAEIEEQRRLFYVGITRVKAKPSDGLVGKLYLTYCQRMPMGTALSANIEAASFRSGIAYLQPSRFLGEFGPSRPTPESL